MDHKSGDKTPGCRHNSLLASKVDQGEAIETPGTISAQTNLENSPEGPGAVMEATHEGGEKAPKKPYAKPTVIELGDFKTLTQAKRGRKNDGFGLPRSRLVWGPE